MKPYLSIIIPVLNEARDIPLALAELDHFLESVDYSSEIVLVDRGSSDRSRETVGKFSEAIKNLKFLKPEEAIGEGEAVERGILKSKGNIRFIMEISQVGLIGKFNNLISFFSPGSGEKYDVVNGIRGGGRIRRFLLRVISGIKFEDPASGFKIFKEEAASNVFDSVRSKTSVWRVESIAVARAKGLRIKEIDLKCGLGGKGFLPSGRSGLFWKELVSFLINLRKNKNEKI